MGTDNPTAKKPTHPGTYIKTQVLPTVLSVKEAAEVLGVGRPALSNLLNGNASLSPEMAVRLEKAFGANKKELLQMQADFDQFQTRAHEGNIAVRTYVPSFLKITARDIEGWAEGNIEARSRLAVFLRKLVHSTGDKLSRVDFPGYDNAETRGWDGEIDAEAATPWIPQGMSRWQFGCNKEPKQKADQDYANRVRALPPRERGEITFIFVTPRRWAGKDNWVKQKQELGEWKRVIVYDSSNLEQWLEQSIGGQAWLADQIGRPSEGVESLDQHWKKWASVAEPELPRSLFKESVESHKAKVKARLAMKEGPPLIIAADSKGEALAFLHCLFDSEEFAAEGYRDRAIVFSSAPALRKLVATSSGFIPIVFDAEVERELGSAYKSMPTFIVRPRNAVETNPDIVLDLLNHETFKEALATVGIEGDRVDTLARESGYSPTILRRRLSNPKLHAIRTPAWADNGQTTRTLVPMMLVGAWNAQSTADPVVLSLLTGCPYDEVERQIADLLKFDDPPMWSVGQYRGVSSKIDAFFAIQGAVTQKDLDDFFVVAEIVLSETDPALELPADKRWAAGIHGKTRAHSDALGEGICETLVLLAVYGNNLFGERLGINVEQKVQVLIRRLLVPLTEEKLLSQSGSLPLYAEAAPDEFLRILEEDLRSSQPQVYTLMKPGDTGVFGTCPRAGLLWALETLAWKPERLLRVSIVLAKLAELKIADNWANKPDGSLLSIFRSWMPQTAASLNERQKVLETLSKRYPKLAWRICVSQLTPPPRLGHYNHRPRWRSDASGAGQPVSREQNNAFVRNVVDLVLGWRDHNEDTLGDLIENLSCLSEKHQRSVWDLIHAWGRKEQDDTRRAVLRERIRRFAFTRRSKRHGIESGTKDRAREAYVLLTPQDLVVRHRWLFATNWVDESSDELEDENLDLRKRDEGIRRLRIEALREIWKARGFEGIQALLGESQVAWPIGRHLAEGVIEQPDATQFIRECLQVSDRTMATRNDELISVLVQNLEDDIRVEVTQFLLGTLPPREAVRLLKCMPFQKDTWLHLESLDPQMRKQYWNEVHPGWIRPGAPDINESVDKLLQARRPRAAFASVHLILEEVETSRLKRLLHEIAICDSEEVESYRLHAHDISSALDILQARPGVAEEEMARLEFLFIRVLDHSKHRIPNLERQLGKSPPLFVQVLALVYDRSDDGEDPPEWQFKDPKQREAIWQAAYTLLDQMRHIPGTDESRSIDGKNLRKWVTDVRSLCLQHAREVKGDRAIGKILASAPEGADSVWPCEPVREVLEEIGSKEIAAGMAVGVYNRRGAVWRAKGGTEERKLAAKYRNWSQQLAFDYPYVADLVTKIAMQYDHEAVVWDSEEAVRRRLGQ